MTSNPIPRTSLHDELVELIRNLITEGDLPVGQRVSEIALCERFGVSRTPLREALKVLASEGLVSLLPNRGAVVSRLEVSDVEEIFPVLGVLEGLAGHLAASTVSTAEIAEIRTLHREMVQRFSANDLPGYFKLNQTIHERIIDAAGNSTLLQMHRSLSMRVRRARYLANLTATRWQQAIREHEEILAALEARDGSRLAAALQRHLAAKAETIIAYLKTQFPADGASASRNGRRAGRPAKTTVQP